MNPNWSPGGCIVCGSMTGRTYALSKYPKYPVCGDGDCGLIYLGEKLDESGPANIILTAAGLFVDNGDSALLPPEPTP